MGDRSDTDSVREAVRDYKEGDVVEIADENEDEGFTGVAQASGAATGAAIVGGALAAVGGLPGALAGAAMGAIGGSIAGSAMAKEWVRGEDIHSAMEFDQHQEGHKSPPPRVVSIGSTPLPEVHELTKPTQRPAEESHS